MTADLAGTFLFGMEGAIAGIGAGLDLFGLAVVAFATALGGGLIRDLLIGAVPPNAIRDWRYGATAFSAALLTFLLYTLVREIPGNAILILDAAGLELFAVAGAAKALEYGIHPWMAILLGTITGVGGGVTRDIFLARVPAVLTVDIYATAALAGAAVMVAGLRLGGQRVTMMTAGGIACFAIRLIAAWQHWNLPRILQP